MGAGALRRAAAALSKDTHLTMTNTLSVRTRMLPVAAGVLAMALLGACSSTSTPAATPTGTATGVTGGATAKATGQAAALSVSDAWVKAADTGMTGAFMVLKNTGSADIHIVSASSDAATKMELHETVMSTGGAMQMQEKKGGFVVKSGATLTFKPGSDHVMFMGLTRALKSGTTVTLALKLEDGSTLPITAQVRTFSAANETYVPGATTGTNGMPTTGKPTGMPTTGMPTSHG